MPPTSSREMPQVVVWYRAYCGLMTFLFLLLVGVGGYLAFFGVQTLPTSGPEEEVAIQASGWFYLVAGSILIWPFALGIFLGNASWCWIYGIVLICLSFTSGCCLPVGIPLLIFWLKPETKRYYGRPA